jgi:hypothetical protein
MRSSGEVLEAPAAQQPLSIGKSGLPVAKRALAKIESLN